MINHHGEKGTTFIGIAVSTSLALVFLVLLSSQMYHLQTISTKSSRLEKALLLAVNAMEALKAGKVFPEESDSFYVRIERKEFSLYLDELKVAVYHEKEKRTIVVLRTLVKR